MLIRTKHDPKLNRTRVQIVQSVRTGNKVRKKILHHVGGVHNNGEIEVIERAARQFMEQLHGNRLKRGFPDGDTRIYQDVEID